MPTETYHHLIALPQGERSVYLSWRLDAISPQTVYFVQRRQRMGMWETVSNEISNSTNFIEVTPEAAPYEYRLLHKDNPAMISEVVSVDSATPATNVWLHASLPGEVVWPPIILGDLDNDGRLDFVVKYCVDDRIWFAGMRGDGKILWTRDSALPTHGGWDGASHHVPSLCWDVDNDGRTEFVFHHGGDAWPQEEEGDYFYDQGRPGELLVIADAETGETKRTAPWSAVKPRVMMTVGHLRGRDNPAHIVVLDETYSDVTVTAIDGGSGELYWRVDQARPAGHNLDVGDIDGDGVQEVIVGGICYNGDGSVRWEAEEFGHTDMSKPANVDPTRPGLEIWYLVESNNPGVYLVDCHGKTIFKEAYRHAHFGWIAKHTDEAEGLQLHAAEDRRKKENEEHHPVFLNDSTHWLGLTNEQSRDLMPVQWDAGACTVFIQRKEKRIVALDQSGKLTPLSGGDLPGGGSYGRNILLADVVGDFRENIVTCDEATNELLVICNPTHINTRQLSPMESFYYRHDRSQHGSGYYMYVSPHISDEKMPDGKL